MLIEKGSLLIADPSIVGDPCFHRAVVLITAISKGSPLGFILNKPYEVDLDHILPELSHENFPLFYGGPVDSDQLFFLHKRPDLIEGSIQVHEQIYWGGNIEQAIDAIDKGELTPINSRFFLGYSGWEKGQLAKELRQKSWLTPSNKVTIGLFHIPTIDLWKVYLKSFGEKYLIWANSPDNPSYN